MRRLVPLILACVLLAGCGSASVAGHSSSAGEPLDPLLLGSEVEGTLGEGIESQTVAIRFEVLHSGTVEKVGVHTNNSLQTAKSVVEGIYEDVAGKPGLLISEGVSGTPTEGAWVEATLGTPVKVSKGSHFWLAYLPREGSLEVKLTPSCCEEETLSGAFTKLEPFTGATAHTFGQALRGMGIEEEAGGSTGKLVMLT